MPALTTPWAKRLVAAVAVLVLLDLTGGLIAVATDVNEIGSAWSAKARLAAPWPMILVQVALTAAALLPRRGVAVSAASLLAGACLVSAISGFFDGALAAEELSAGHVVFQVLLIAWTGLVGALAFLHVTGLVREPDPAQA